MASPQHHPARSHEAFGRVLRRERSAKELSQDELAARAGIHRDHVGFLERGERQPSLDTILALSRVLGLTGAELVAKVEEVLRGG